jgi:hypothetical protein
MRIKTIAMAAALCCLGLMVSAGAANAQMGGMGMARSIPAMGGKFNPTIGLGADYDMAQSNGEQSKLSIAIVGKDSINGSTGYWMEFGVSGAKVPGTTYIKSLAVVDSSGQMVTQRVIMQANGQTFQMPDQMVKMHSRTTHTDISSDGTNLGSESISVPAGTFTAEHWRSKDGDDFWITKDAGPWGLVKMKSKDGSTMVLTKAYTDAKDQITDTPQPFPGMGQR